ncbi:MAG: DNA-binding response regulator [Bacteroidetes bacterium]|nr:MAG: DNA-binding response regulator [Bacteroidota bacterium]
MTNEYQCLIIDDDKVARKVISHYVEITASLNLIEAFDNALEGQKYLLKNPVDILFLDIEMPNMTGIELLQSLPEIPETILTTSHQDFAIPAFELQVSDYLVKPIQYDRFSKAINKVSKKLDLLRVKEEYIANNHDDLFVKVNNRMVKIRFDDIDYIEALSDYVLIFVKDKQLIVYSTLKAVSSKLRGERFMRIHRSYIVNLKKIDAIEDNSVLISNKFIPISKSYRNSFFEKINRL